ncbi:MAG TPA: MFS transporter [Pseudoclavibacter sp.]|nr:MFS transporter [Pseudoclavibacter sp.]
MKAVFASLGIRNYRIWFVGILISNIGLWMARIAQNWLVLTGLTDESGLAVGITIGLQFGPQLLLAPLAGFVADRFDKRHILMWTQVGMGAAAAAQAVLVLTGVVELWHVYVLAALLGCIAAVDSPSRNVFVSELVSRDYLTNAVSLNSVSFNAARLIGPAVAGLLIEVVGPGWAFAINSLTYVATVSALALIRPEPRVVPSPRESGTIRVRDGFRYMAEHPHLIVVTAMMFLIAATAMNTQVTIALMARVQFGRGAGDFGLLNSAMAVGAMGGGLFAAASRAPRLRTLVVSVVGLGVSLALGAMTSSYLLFAVIMFITGFFMIRLATGANAYMQLGAEPRLRGQVMAVYLAMFLGGSPIGAPVIGWIGDAVSPPATLWAGALGCAIAVLAVLAWYVGTGRGSTHDVFDQLVHGDRAVPETVTVEHPETGPIPLPERRRLER